MAALFPELVSVDKDGFQGVSYARAVVLLAQAFKELKEDYDQKLVDMNSKLDQLWARHTSSATSVAEQ